MDPLFCDEDTECRAGLPFCDIEGTYPGSEGVANTCIDYPWDAGPQDAGTAFRIGGSVSGLAGNASLSLRLQSDDIDAVLDVVDNGELSFEEALENGQSYQVTLDQEPAEHDCAVTGGAGTVMAADVSDIEVSCEQAFLASLELSAPAPLSPDFSPGENSYTVSTSVLTQSVSVTATASYPTATITVNSENVASGSASGPIPLALGQSDITIVVSAGDLLRTYTVNVSRGAEVIAQAAYAKASNAEARDEFGHSVAIDGDVLAVGARREDGGAAGINGDENDNSAAGSGAVYIFRRSGDSWQQEAYIKASNVAPANTFGASLALHRDTLVVGASSEGSAYVFRHDGAIWSQEARLVPFNPVDSVRFGATVTVHGDLVAVGDPEENDTQPTSGAVYVFRRSGAEWTMEDYVKASNIDDSDEFGGSVALRGDTLAVGAVGEASNATGVNGDDSNNSSGASGAVYVFRRGGTQWQQEAYIKASNTDMNDRFGAEIAIGDDVLAISAPDEDSASTGVGGFESNGADDSGAVYVFRRSGVTWSQETYIKSSNSETGDNFGSSISVDGDMLAVGAASEGSSGTGLNPPSDNDAPGSGAVYVFRYDGSEWSQVAFLKPSNTQQDDIFGSAVSISQDALVVGARQESSNATGVGGDQTNNDAARSGAVYIFH